MVTNLDLYEALKAKLGEKAARMVADVVPAAEHLATKADLSQEVASLREDLSREIGVVRDELRQETKALRADIGLVRDELRQETKALRADIGRLDVRMAQMETRLLRWTLAFFIPLWVSVLGTMWAMLLKV